MVDSVVKDTNLYFKLHFQDIKYFKYFFFISAWLLCAAIQSAVVEQFGSAVFDQSQEHFFDHSLSIEVDHLTTLLRLVTEKYVLLRLKTYSKRLTELMVHKNEPSLRHRLTKTILFKNQ